jgi:chromosome segregation ATPase
MNSHPEQRVNQSPCTENAGVLRNVSFLKSTSEAKVVGDDEPSDAKNEALNDQIVQLKHTNRMLQATVEQLSTQFLQTETQIREQFAEELEVLLSTRKAAAKLVLREPQAINTNTEARRYQEQKLRAKISEYQDMLNECEEELQRVRQEHDDELEQCKTSAQNALEIKDRELAGLRERLEALQTKCAELERSLNTVAQDHHYHRAASEEATTELPLKRVACSEDTFEPDMPLKKVRKGARSRVLKEMVSDA